MPPRPMAPARRAAVKESSTVLALPAASPSSFIIPAISCVVFPASQLLVPLTLTLALPRGSSSMLATCARVSRRRLAAEEGAWITRQAARSRHTCPALGWLCRCPCARVIQSCPIRCRLLSVLAAPPPTAAPPPPAPAAAAPRVWQRGSCRHSLPACALSLEAERRHSTAASADASGYTAALAASLSRSTLSTAQLEDLATSPVEQGEATSMLDGYHQMQPYLAAAMAALGSDLLDELLSGWALAADERPPGFDAHQTLALRGLAGAGEGRGAAQGGGVRCRPLADTGGGPAPACLPASPNARRPSLHRRGGRVAGRPHVQCVEG